MFIGIKQNIHLNVERVKSDANGRYIILQYTYENQQYLVISLYAPNKDDPMFFGELFHEIEKFEGRRIICGDFNLALNVQQDRFSLKQTVGNKKVATETLVTYMQDIWRVRNPTLRHYTYRQNNPKAMSRIDFFLVDQSIMNWTHNIKINPGYKSDHSCIFIEILTHNIQRGQGIWKLNNRLLTEIDFVNGINSEIEKACSLAKNLEASETWEMVKLGCIKYSQKYAKNRAENRKLIISQLIENIDKLTKEEELSIRPGSSLLSRSRLDLEELMEEKAKGAIFRSKCKWEIEAGKPTHYFLNLEKNRSASKNMLTLVKENGDTVDNINLILNEQRKFYQNLFTSNPYIKFNVKHDNLPTISEEERESMDSEITLQELTVALKSAKRNTSPGCDGLTTEFFIVFWERLGHLLHSAAIACLDKGQMFPTALKGIVVTIPKKQKDTRFLRNLRPITLLNTDFKLIEKVLAMRIKPLLVNIIHEDQKGFM